MRETATSCRWVPLWSSARGVPLLELMRKNNVAAKEECELTSRPLQQGTLRKKGVHSRKKRRLKAMRLGQRKWGKRGYLVMCPRLFVQIHTQIPYANETKTREFREGQNRLRLRSQREGGGGLESVRNFSLKRRANADESTLEVFSGLDRVSSVTTSAVFLLSSALGLR